MQVCALLILTSALLLRYRDVTAVNDQVDTVSQHLGQGASELDVLLPARTVYHLFYKK